MQIRLPGSTERDVQIVGQDRAENSHIAGTRDVNEVRREITQEPGQPEIMPQKEKIEFVMAVQWEFEMAAAHLHLG